MGVRTLVIGLDGATFTLLRPMIGSGNLPVISKIVDEGASIKLTSTNPPLTAPAWSSLFTGKNPGQHGVYDFFVRDGFSYGMIPAQPPVQDSLFTILSRNGLSVVGLDIPFVYPPPQVDGVFVCGIGSPGKSGQFVYPPDYADRLETLTGGYIVDVEWGRYNVGDEHLVIEQALEMTRQRSTIAEYLLDQRDWDLFMVVFNGTDRLQHCLWRHLESVLYGIGTKDQTDIVGSQAVNVFSVIDKSVGSMMARGYDDVIILSDHGFGDLNATVNLNQWLWQSGFLTPSSGGTVATNIVKSAITRFGLDNQKVKKALSSLIRVLRLPAYQQGLGQLSLSIDWDRTYAWSWSVNGISLNVRGREPRGIIDPSEYGEICERIIAELVQWRHPNSGEPLVYEARRKDDVYSGACISQAPDIIITKWNEKFWFVGSNLSQDLFRASQWYSGSHRMDGILIMQGIHVAEPIGAPTDSANIEDVFPTLLCLSGVKAPPNIDGRLLDQVVNSEQQLIDEKSSPSELDARHDEGFSAEEQRAIYERLRGLGYMD